jgi:hypothetical protein
MDKRRFTTAVGKYLISPIVKAAITLRLAPLGYAILKTTGRKAGCADRPRSEMGSTATPSGWSPSTVAARPTCATSKPTPRVRVKVRGTWHAGTVHALSHDHPGSPAVDRSARQRCCRADYGHRTALDRIDLDP